MSSFPQNRLKKHSTTVSSFFQFSPSFLLVFPPLLMVKKKNSFIDSIHDLFLGIFFFLVQIYFNLFLFSKTTKFQLITSSLIFSIISTYFENFMNIRVVCISHISLLTLRLLDLGIYNVKSLIRTTTTKRELKLYKEKGIRDEHQD